MRYIRVSSSIFLLLFTTYAIAQNTMPCVWNGYSIGVNVGLADHRLTMTDVNAATYQASIQQDSNPRLTGGLQLTYLYQLGSQMLAQVYGLDLSYNYYRGQFNRTYGSPFALYQLHTEQKLENTVLLEALGGLAIDRTYLFLGAGVAWTRISGSTTNVTGVPFFTSYDMGGHRFGVAWSMGLQYLISEKYSLRFKVDMIKPTRYSTQDNVNNNYDIDNCIMQATIGINYKLG